MESDIKIARLRESPLFSGLSNDELQKVLSIAEIRKYAKNAVIFSEGEDAAGFFSVDKGKVKIYKLGGDGREHIFHIVTNGGIFAEAAVFSGATYPAYAQALAESALFYFPQKPFYSLIKDNPQISLNMLATLSMYLRRFSNLVEEMSLNDLSSRLAKYILNEAVNFNGNSFELNIKKGELASQMGTISETLSRAFNKLKLKGMIDVKGRYIYILDKEKLFALAQGKKDF